MLLLFEIIAYILYMVEMEEDQEIKHTYLAVYINLYVVKY